MLFARFAPILRLPFVLSTTLLVGPAAAQAAGDFTSETTGTPVVFGADTLFTLHGRLGPFGPVERAIAVEQRLTRMSRTLAVGGDSILVTQVEQRSELLVGDVVLMSVLDADAAPTGTPRPALAAAWAARMQQAVVAHEAASSLRSLTIDATKAGAVTLVLILLLLGLRALFGRVLAALRGPRLPPLRIKRFELLSARRFGEALAVVTRAVRVVLTLLLLYFYVPLVLSFFPWTAPWSRKIIGYVLTPLTAAATGFLDYLPNVFFLITIVLVTRYVLKLIRLIFRAIGTGALALEGFHRDWAGPTFNIVRFLVLAFAVIVMFPYLPGAGSDAFKGVSLFIGVLFSFGSSSAIGNVIAGVVLTYTNAFRIGDRVQIGETVGDVVERTLLVTRIRTIKNVAITVPNGAVLASQVINFSAPAADRGLILHTTVTIGYDAPWRQVHDLLIAAAGATEDLLAEPAPFVLQTSLDDFFVSYQINAYTDRPAVMAATYSRLHQNIQDRFNEAGVEIMSPHFRALRDGNQATIPAEHLGTEYRAPAFRVVGVPEGRSAG